MDKKLKPMYSKDVFNRKRRNVIQVLSKVDWDNNAPARTLAGTSSSPMPSIVPINQADPMTASPLSGMGDLLSARVQQAPQMGQPFPMPMPQPQGMPMMPPQGMPMQGMPPMPEEIEQNPALGLQALKHLSSLVGGR